MRRLHESPFLLSSVAATLSASVFWVVVMVAIPQLHEALHHDAGEHGHECAVTMFLGAACGSAPVVRFTPVFLRQQISMVTEEPGQEAAALFLLTCVLEHAPPLIS